MYSGDDLPLVYSIVYVGSGDALDVCSGEGPEVCPVVKSGVALPIGKVL